MFEWIPAEDLDPDLLERVRNSEVAQDYEFEDETVEIVFRALYDYQVEDSHQSLLRLMSGRAKEQRLSLSRATTALRKELYQSLSNWYVLSRLAKAYSKSVAEQDSSTLVPLPSQDYSETGLWRFTCDISDDASDPVYALVELEHQLTVLERATEALTQPSPSRLDSLPQFKAGRARQRERLLPLITQLRELSERYLSEDDREEPRFEFVRDILRIVVIDRDIKTLQNMYRAT